MLIRSLYIVNYLESLLAVNMKQQRDRREMNTVVKAIKGEKIVYEILSIYQ